MFTVIVWKLVYLKCLVIICMKGCYDAIFMLSIGVVPGGARECPLSGEFYHFFHGVLMGTIIYF